MKAYYKAESELDKYLQHWIDLIFLASTLALYDMGWRKNRIQKLLDYAEEIFEFCAKGEYTLVELCYTETGIEFNNRYNESFRDTVFLCKENWDKELPRFSKLPQQMKIAYMIREKQQMKKWAEPQVMSSIALALHRKEKWGGDRIEKVVIKMYEKLEYYNYDVSLMIEEIKNLVGIIFIKLKSGDLAVIKEDSKCQELNCLKKN